MLEFLALIVTICVVIWTIYVVAMGRMTMKYMKVYEKMMKNVDEEFKL